MRARVMICVVACLPLLSPACAARRRSLEGLAFPYRYTGDINRSRLEEPSGIVYHPGRKTLFAVGDEGDICEITTEGELVGMRNLGEDGKEDFEGIAVNPGTGLLYAAVEGKDVILEIDPESLDVLREYPLERTYGGKPLIAMGGQGIEGIAFVPDQSGNTFYVTNQSYSLENEADPSIIMKVRLPLDSPSEQGRSAAIVEYFSPGIIDISGIFYNAGSDTLVALSDAENIMFEIGRDGSILSARPMPGRDQEGLATDDEGNLYIAQDSGEIIKYVPK